MRRLGLIAIVGLVLVCLVVGWQWYSRREQAAQRMAAWEAERAEDAIAPEFAQQYEWPRGVLTLDEFAQLVTAKSGLAVEIEYEAISGDWRTDEPRRLRKVSVPQGKFTLGAMLKMVLTPVQLHAEEQGSSVVITSVAWLVNQRRVRTRMYPLPPGVKGLGEGDWKYLISSNLDGQVEALPGAVVVVGNAEAQRRARLVIDTVMGLREPNAPSVAILPENEGPAAKRIAALLDQPVEVDVVEMPLKDVTLYLVETYSIPLVLMADKLEEASVSVDTPITKSLKDISLRSALRLILKDLELTFVLRDGAVLITTPEGAEENLQIIAHWVRGVVEEFEGELDTYPLTMLIGSCIAPDSWDTGGPNIRAIQSGWLIFEQTSEVHEEVASLVAALRQILATKSSAAMVHSPPMTEATQKIHAALNHEIELSLKSTPLKDVATYLADTLKIPVMLSQKKLEEASISPDTPVTFQMPRARSGLGLELLLHDLELTYVVRDEVLQITTPEDAESQLVTRLYDVRSLVESKHLQVTVDDLVPKLVQPQSWDFVRGPGVCQAFRGILVVSQTQDVQEKITPLLDMLRKCDAEMAKPSGDKAIVIRPEPTTEQARLEKALEQVVSVDVESGILKAALEELATEHKLPVVLEGRAYRQARIPFLGFDVAVRPFAAEMTLGGALDRLLLPLNLDYVIRENVIWVSHTGHTDAALETRLHCIDDLAKSGEKADEIGEQAAFAVENARGALSGSSAAINSIAPNWLLVVAPRSRQEDVADWLVERRRGKTPTRAEERRALYERIVAGEL